jgi:hypothetical protein
MRRVPDNLEISLPPVRLYLDDLEHILHRLSDDMEAQIEHRGFTYDSLEELKDHIKRDTISELRMSAEHSEPPYGYLSVYVAGDGVRVSAGHTAAERASSITEFLRPRVPWYSWRPIGNWWYGIQGVFAMLLGLATFVAIDLLVPLPTALRLLLAVIASLLVGSLAFTNRVWFVGSRILLYPSVSHVGFWERNREKILVSITSSVLSGLVGFLLGRLTH